MSAACAGLRMAAASGPQLPLPEVRLLINPYMQLFEGSALAKSPARACSCPGAGNVVAAKHVPGTQCMRHVPD